MRLLNDIIGKEIVDGSGNVIGKVKDIEIDPSSKILDSIIITKSESRKKLMSTNEEEKIPFEMINGIGDKIMLKKDLKDSLDNIINI
ncbi:MAG TPA: photosystem reaction center subunit H [Methanosphaera sp.]|nr:photosystem reaction center subunit H [Methanosphaera sp.]HII09264.1 photosystem reaction center subunit H [Methanosphaera sp.]HIJ14935.1 photosystem reaction center subunit H [Methanosphaera sp.]